MKKNICLYLCSVFLAAVGLLLCACSREFEDSYSKEFEDSYLKFGLKAGSGQSDALTVAEARAYFEALLGSEWAQNAFAWGSGKGLDPGVFSPRWESATVSHNGETVSVEAGIDAAYIYFVRSQGSDGDDADNGVLAVQKLLVVKNGEGATGCYIMTVIPNAGCVAGFTNGWVSSGFGGFVVYTRIGLNVPVRIDEYENGIKVHSASFFEDGWDPDVFGKMDSLLSGMRVDRYASAPGTRAAPGGDIAYTLVLEGITVTPQDNKTVTEIEPFPDLGNWSWGGENDRSSYSPDPNEGGGSGGTTITTKPNKSLRNTNHFKGYAKPGDCYDNCAKILTNNGQTNHGSPYNVHKLMVEKTVNGKTSLLHYGSDVANNYKQAIECIDRHLNNDRLIIVGINHDFDYRDKNGNLINEGTTDHFVVIYGREYNTTTGKYEYLYYEVARSHPDNGCSPLNRFIYDPSIFDFYNPGTAIAFKNNRLDVTQVRPNDGNIAGTISQFAP